MYYYVKTDETGWIYALASDGKTAVHLCAYTKAQVITKKGGRTLFKIGDGPNKDKVVSLSDANAAIHLSSKPTDAPTQAEAVLNVVYGKMVNKWYSKARNDYLDQQMATLSFSGKSVQVTLNSVWGTGFTPIPTGTYKIRIPDYPHAADMTSFYRKVAPNLKYDRVWFPIEYGNNSRFVHVGNLSDGCVTVLDIDKWNDVYAYLIKYRTTSSQHVGKIVVK